MINIISIFCCYYWKGKDQDIVLPNCNAAYMSRALVIIIIMRQSLFTHSSLCQALSLSLSLFYFYSPHVKVGLTFTTVLYSLLIHISDVHFYRAIYCCDNSPLISVISNMNLVNLVTTRGFLEPRCFKCSVRERGLN